MEPKGRAARLLVRKLIGASSDGDAAATDEAISEMRRLSKDDPDFRPILADAGAVPLLAHHLLLFSSSAHQHSASSQEDAAAALLNVSISSREPLMATPGLLDALAATLRRPAAPAAAQHAAAALYSLLSVDIYRPIIGAKEEIASALIAMLRPTAPPQLAPTRSVKDALKALFGLALYPLNRAALVRTGAVPPLFSLIVKDGRAGIVEDCTAVVAQVAGCEESLEAFRRASGVQILVDLVDAATGASPRSRENAAAALLNLALSGGERALEDIREVETALPAVRELAEAGTTPRAKSKAGALLSILVDRHHQQEGQPRWLESDPDISPPFIATANGAPERALGLRDRRLY
ncbi:hypothetical protein Taro_024312 [Colocasia esculenta]|uniref:U-box domain-containing protein n=1 Tax=Colocasia esculenta TaxID=4460 RepID=A0A843V6H5_COLES|nr:hypothetical protein [Colocasia esculenta]